GESSHPLRPPGGQDDGPPRPGQPQRGLREPVAKARRLVRAPHPRSPLWSSEHRRMTPPRIPGALREGERRLPPPGPVADVARRHPLHPPEPAVPGRDEAGWSTVAGGQRCPSDVRRQEERRSIGTREPTAVAGDRPDD